MSGPFEGLLFLIVPGFLTVNGNLFSNDQEMGEAMMLEMHRTTRPPHKIFFYENGDRIERIVEDDLGLHPDVPIINMGSQFGNGGFAGRGVGPLPNNSSGILDSIPLNNFLSQPTNFNLNKGDGSSSFISQNELPQKDIKEFPTIFLSPQQFFHIKVSIPRAYYTTQVYQDTGDSDIIEVISRPNSMIAARAVGNMNPGSPQSSSQQLLNNFPINLASFPSPPQTVGWSPSGTGSPTQRAISGFQPNESPASPYLGSSMLSLGSPGQYNSQNNEPSNFNKASADFGGNTQYGGLRGVDNPVQNVPHFPQGMKGFGQPNSPFQNGQSFSQSGQSFGQPSSPGQNVAQFLQGGHSFGQPNNQMSQYPNPSQSGGVNDYNRGLQNPGNPVRPSSLFSSFSSRSSPAGVPTSFANADPIFKNTQPPSPVSNRISQNILNAVRSLDDGTESAP